MQQDGERLDDIEAEQSKLESKLDGALSAINEASHQGSIPNMVNESDSWWHDILTCMKN